MFGGLGRGAAGVGGGLGAMLGRGIGGMPPGPAAYAPNIGLQVGTAEAQAARQRARMDTKRVPEKSLTELKEIKAGINRLIELAKEAGATVVEEVRLR